MADSTGFGRISFIDVACMQVFEVCLVRPGYPPPLGSQPHTCAGLIHTGAVRSSTGPRSVVPSARAKLRAHTTTP